MVRFTENTPVLRYAALLNSLEPEEARSLLRRLKMDNHTVDSVTAIVANSKGKIDENEPAIREALNRLGKDLMNNLLIHSEALAKAKEEITGVKLYGTHNHIVAVRKMMEGIIDRGDCFTIKDLDITGNDLIEYGMSGSQIGRTLNELLHVVMDNPKLNDKATLIAMLDHFQ